MKAFAAAELPALFNEWMRQFTLNPTAFESEFQAVGVFLAEQGAGRVPTYGDGCVRVLDRVRAELANIPTVTVKVQVVKSAKRKKAR